MSSEFRVRSLCIATLISAEGVIPAKAGIQEENWIPPYPVRGRLIKPGMTNQDKTCAVMLNN
jgi:hypothetical protein